ncbi:MAG: VCBS repeat-containing protein, partial [Candidatus Thermoplasmatota archaeon]|nr:VCBS repeat-containing protein [Candidatus Thermoplasmatota archaeon]
MVGVEVSGGNAHLMTGYEEGRITSVAITCPEDYRYDLVLLDAVLPGNSSVNISILDPSKPSTMEGFVNEPVPGFINMTGTDESVFRISTTKFPKVQIQVNLIADGTDRPRLLAWSLHFITQGEWREDFLGTGKMTSYDGINITGSIAELDLSDGGGGVSYGPYPPVLFPDASGDVDVFYPTTGNDDYQNGATIANTASTQGMDCDDLDDDGYLDIVLTAGGNLNSMILWGSSSGKWSTYDKTDLVHTDPGMDAAIGDFDGDGMKDVVISALGLLQGDGAYVYLNNGDGSFDKDPDIKLGTGSTAVDAGDLNNDGYDDIVLNVALGGGADCYFGGSNGPDTTSDIGFLKGGTATVTPNEVLVQDVDQDGYLDVLFAVLVNTEAPVFIGGASGPDTTVDYKLLLKSSPMDVSAGDINADGYIDIAYSTRDNSGAGSNIEIFKGTSTGWNKNDKHVIAAGNGLHPVEVVDIDVDGYADIVTGETASFLLYMGGSTWPTSADLTKAGPSGPQDVAVASPKGGGGGAFRGSFLTDPIPRPTDMRWDILHLDGTVPMDTSVTITVLDSSQDPIPGLEQLTDPDVDLSGIMNWQEIYVKVDLWSESNDSTPVIRSLLVNWMDQMAWRDQFYGNAKTESALGVGAADLMLRDTDHWASGRNSFIFASLRNDGGYFTRSVGFLDAGGRDYTSQGPIYFNTKGAMAISALDIDGDHFEELVFASYGTSVGSYTGTSPLFLGSPAGWYETPYHSFPTTGARDVILSDLNQDGYADVVFAQERDWQGPFVKSTLFWGSASGWNATPDVEFSTTGASGVEAVDLDNDGLDDLAFACYEGADYETDSMVFLQESAGYCGTVPSIRLPTVGARAVKAANLDTDGYADLV